MLSLAVWKVKGSNHIKQSMFFCSTLLIIKHFSTNSLIKYKREWAIYMMAFFFYEEQNPFLFSYHIFLLKFGSPSEV